MSRVEDFIQGAFNKVPGYKGYRDKEDRRDADKMVRDSISAALGQQIDVLTRYNAELANARDFESLAALEPAIGQIRLLSDRVRTTSYGYGGIFTDDGVDANALEQLRLFDSALLREVDSLAAAVSKLTASTPPDANARSGIVSEINRLATLFDTRSSVVQQGRPSDDEEALQLLAIPAKVERSPLLDVKKGDALSHMDDNYIANGTISLRTDDGNIVLARVSSETEGATWLLGSSVSGMGSAKLTERAGTSGGFQTMTNATATISTDQGEEKDVVARYSYRDLGDNRVEFTLALGDTIKAFEGSTIVDNDLEVYGVA